MTADDVLAWLAERRASDRDVALHGAAVAASTGLGVSEGRAARWVGSDALRELQSEKLRARLGLPG